MTAPALASLDAAKDRFYRFGDPPEAYWSVTTIISGGVPKYLGRWYAKEVADLALADLTSRGPHSRGVAAIRAWARAGLADVRRRQAAGELGSINAGKLTDLEAAARWLKGQPERIRDAAGDVGRDFHDEAERTVLRLANATGLAVAGDGDMPVWPEHLVGHRTSFEAFLREWRPQYLATEATIFNRKQAYAGTLDAGMVLRIGGRDRSVALDYKSGRDTYHEVALQLSAYRRGEFIGLADGVTALPMPQLDLGAVLHIPATGGYRLRLVRVDDAVFRHFLHARETFRYLKEIAPTVFLQDLQAEAQA